MTTAAGGHLGTYTRPTIPNHPLSAPGYIRCVFAANTLLSGP